MLLQCKINILIQPRARKIETLPKWPLSNFQNGPILIDFWSGLVRVFILIFWNLDPNPDCFWQFLIRYDPDFNLRVFSGSKSVPRTGPDQFRTKIRTTYRTNKNPDRHSNKKSGTKSVQKIRTTYRTKKTRTKNPDHVPNPDRAMFSVRVKRGLSTWFVHGKLGFILNNDNESSEVVSHHILSFHFSNFLSRNDSLGYNRSAKSQNILFYKIKKSDHSRSAILI